VVLWQADCSKRVPYDGNPDGFYYWTSVWYMDRADFGSDNAFLSAVQNAEGLSTLSIAFLRTVHVKSSPGRGNVIRVVDVLAGEGGIAYDDSGYSLLSIARVTWRSTTNRYSYRLHRQPLMSSQMDGLYLTGAGTSSVESQMNGVLAVAPIRNKYGERITHFSVDPLLHGWQLRHGTKRRERNPLV